MQHHLIQATIVEGEGTHRPKFDNFQVLLIGETELEKERLDALRGRLTRRSMVNGNGLVYTVVTK